MARRQPALRQHLHRARACRSSRGSAPRARRCSPRPPSSATSRLGPVTGIAVGLRSGRGRARLDRDRSDLVATVAHELRSPLTGRQGLRPGAAQPLGQAHRRPAQAHAHDGQRRRRPPRPPDRRAARRGPHRHRPAPALPARVLAPRCWCGGSSSPSRPAPRARSCSRSRTTCPRSSPTPTSSPRSSPTSSRTPYATGRASCASSLAALPSTRRGAHHRRRRGRGHPGRAAPPRLHQVLDHRRVRAAPGWACTSSGGLSRAHGGLVTIEDAPGGGARVMVDWPSVDLRVD